MQFIINHIETIITQYEGHPPLAAYLKDYFRQHAKLGSRDRRAISEAIFIYYRCATFQIDENMTVPEKIKQGMVWCNSDNAFLQRVLQDVEEIPLLPSADDYALQTELSYEIEAEDWLNSLRVQPRLFIRARKKTDAITAILNQADIPFEIINTPVKGDNCIALPNGSKIDQLLDEAYYAVQDLSSQRSLQIAATQIGINFFANKNLKVWDVCSGAGGKSLLFKDMFAEIAVTATDVRESILHNLRVRMRHAGVKGVETICLNAADLHELDRKMPDKTFDFIICDVPCSGSGTWARTPEQFYFFDHNEVADFAALQYNIAAHAAARLNAGGYLCYITCSVFLQENELVTDRLKEQLGLTMVHRQIIDGIALRADSMFVAILKK